MIHKSLHIYDDTNNQYYHDRNQHQQDKNWQHPTAIKRPAYMKSPGLSPFKDQKSTLSSTHRVSFRRNPEICHCSQIYQSQIRILEKYLKTATKIDKNTILYIFGLHSTHEMNSLQSQSLMLKELSEKIKKLLQQNSRLKRDVLNLQASNKQAIENQRYSKQQIIVEISKTKAEVIEKLIAENQGLKQQIKILEKQFRNKAEQNDKSSNRWKEILDQLKKQLQTELQQFYESIQSQNNNLTICMTGFQQRVIQNELALKNVQSKIAARKNQQVQRQQKFIIKSQQDDKSSKLANNQYNSRYFTNNDKKNKNSTTVFKNINKYASHHAQPDKQQIIQILQNKNEKLLRDMQILTNRLAQLQETLHLKIQKILLLENQLHILKNNSTSVKSRQYSANKNISDEIVKIRQLLLSCNPSNFEMFQKQFQEILSQRNQFNQKLSLFKQMVSKKNKHRHKQYANTTNENDNKKIFFLQEKVKRLEEDFQLQKNRNLQLQKELQKLKGYQDSISCDVLQQINKMSQIKAPNGYSGLQWQVIVQKCIQQTSNRLKMLSESLTRQK